ncbi:H-NS histone family protein [Paraburkholderia caribensis]|uniref:H-NS histone family protein n=1 Tax=Paraburkholderia caribensis TaxID=75105 RepID=UPI00078CA710|nr:H-NS histone family protein [Paraburkholderia caribensis]AMV47816.1 hypothetical protein ATN79_44930 [Paraburkholderia caribensis]
MATLSEIEGRIQKLQSQADAIRRKETDKAIAAVKKIMAAYHLTVDQLGEGPLPPKKRGRPAASQKAVVRQGFAGKALQASRLTKAGKKDGRKGPRPAMYRHPETGATWSGWARPPAWIKDVEDRSIYLIDKPASVPAEADVEKSTPKKVASGSKRRAVARAPVVKKVVTNASAAPARKQAAKSKAKNPVKKTAGKRGRPANASAPRRVAGRTATGAAPVVPAAEQHGAAAQ